LLALAAAKLAVKKSPKSEKSPTLCDPSGEMTGKMKFRLKRRAKREKKKLLQVPDVVIPAGISTAFGPVHTAKAEQMAKLWKKSSRKKQKMEERMGAFDGPDLRDHLNAVHSTGMVEGVTPLRAKINKKKSKMMDSYLREEAGYHKDQADFGRKQSFVHKRTQQSSFHHQEENQPTRQKKPQRTRPGQKWRKLEGRINERKNMIIDAYFREQGNSRSKKKFVRKIKQK
jgi:hypothetical protein